MKVSTPISVALALALPVLTLLLRGSLPVSFADRPMLILFMPALIAIALIGGLWPGILATVTTALITDYFLVPPTGSLSIAHGHDLFQWFLLVICGVITSLMAEWSHLSELAQSHSLARLRDAKSEVEAQRRRLDFIVEGTQLGTWEWNLQSGGCAFNERWAQIIGYTLDELSPATREAWERLIHPEDLKKAKDLLDAHFRGAVPYHEVELRMKHKDGSWVWVLERGKVSIWSEDGKPIVMSGTYQEITNQKMMRQSLEESESRFRVVNESLALERAKLRTVVRTIPDLVWLKNSEGTYLLCNPAFEKFVGRSEAEIVGKTDYDFVDRPLAEFFREMDRRAIASGIPTTNQERLRFSSDGYVGLFETTKTPMFDENGALIGVLGISHDVSEAERTHAVLARARDELEEKVKQRTSQLSEAKDAAEAANVAKTNFLANMSHEIRTPMNAIIGMTHLALNAEPPPKVRDYLEKINSASRQLLYVVNDILDFSKTVAGKLKLEKARFRLSDVIESAVNSVREKVAAKELELVVDLSPDVPEYLEGDSVRIGQVLINYLNNAVKFTDAGEIVLSVSAEAVGETDVKLHVRVRDTGIGISDEQQRNLFESFQQADGTITRKYGGTGLGLAIARRLTELMDGHVGVESSSGTGSTFWFSVLVKRGEPEGTDDSKESRWKGKRALVVDDNKAARAVEQSVFKELGIVASATGSGTAALAEVAQRAALGEPYDLLLLDWSMPGMEGAAIARKIREMPLSRQPRILIAAPIEHDELTDLAKALEISDILLKPVTRYKLSASLALDNDLIEKSEVIESVVPLGELLQRASSIQGARILLAEDDDLNREVAEGILKEFGVSVDVAVNGSVAIDMLRSGAYDAVLMDIQMPVMDGLEATSRIRKEHGFNAVPIIALTANVFQSDREKYLSAGMNDVVMKPVEPDRLLDALLKWVPPAAGSQMRLGSGAETRDEAHPNAEVKNPDPKVRRDELDDLYRKLSSLLEHGDTEAKEVFERNADVLMKALPESFSVLEQLVAAYEFEDALLALQRAWKDKFD